MRWLTFVFQLLLSGAVALSAMLVTLRLAPVVSEVFERGEPALYDARMRLLPRVDVGRRVLLVAITKESLAALGDEASPSLARWPWPAAVYGRLSRLLIEQGKAACVVLDADFSQVSDGRLPPEYRDLVDLQRHPFQQVLVMRVDPKTGKPLRPPRGIDGLAGHPGSPRWPTQEDGVRRAAAGDTDGEFTAVWLARLCQEGKEPLQEYQAPYLVRFPGPPGTVPRVSAEDLLGADRLAALLAQSGADSLEDLVGRRVVFVGPADVGLQPFEHTPVGDMPAIEAHAAALWTLQSGQAPVRADRVTEDWLLALAVLLPAFLWAVFDGRAPVLTALAGFVALVALLTTPFMLSIPWLTPRPGPLWLGMITPCAGYALGAITGLLSTALPVRNIRARLCARYRFRMAPKTLRALVRAADKRMLGAVTLPDAVLLVVRLAVVPERVYESEHGDHAARAWRLLAQRLSHELILTGATVMSRSNRRLIAVFGFPHPQEDALRRAAFAALHVQRRFSAMRSQGAQQLYGPERCGIGLARGGLLIAALEPGDHGAATILGEAAERAESLAEDALRENSPLRWDPALDDAIPTELRRAPEAPPRDSEAPR